MPSTIRVPRSGWLCLLGSGLCLSVKGAPVVGSVGSCSQTSEPQSAPPQFVMLIWLSLSLVYQVPQGSAANAGTIRFAPVDSPIAESQSASATLRQVIIATSWLDVRTARRTTSRADKRSGFHDFFVAVHESAFG